MKVCKKCGATLNVCKERGEKACNMIREVRMLEVITGVKPPSPEVVKKVLEKFADYAKWKEVHLMDFLYGMVSGHPLYQKDYKEALKRILDNWEDGYKYGIVKHDGIPKYYAVYWKGLKSKDLGKFSTYQQAEDACNEHFQKELSRFEG